MTISLTPKKPVNWVVPPTKGPPYFVGQGHAVGFLGEVHQEVLVEGEAALLRIHIEEDHHWALPVKREFLRELNSVFHCFDRKCQTILYFYNHFFTCDQSSKKHGPSVGKSLTVWSQKWEKTVLVNVGGLTVWSQEWEKRCWEMLEVSLFGLRSEKKKTVLVNVGGLTVWSHEWEKNCVRNCWRSHCLVSGVRKKNCVSKCWRSHCLVSG